MLQDFNNHPRTGDPIADPITALASWKKILFGLLPLLLLLAMAEIIIASLGWDRPAVVSAHAPSLLDVMGGTHIIQPDGELLWSLRPGVSGQTNRLGLRSPEVQPKRPGERRILSLGESTTYGSFVEMEQTYSYLLQEALHRCPALAATPITVINAGISAYSSYQSLCFLQRRGMALEPDLVLFYHEVNDYLPTVVRDIAGTEYGILKTDRQLLESWHRPIEQILLEASALFRWGTYRFARYRMERFNRLAVRNPLMEIGLPGFAFSPMAYRLEPGKDGDPIRQERMGRRVSDAERLAVLQTLRDTCRQKGIGLVIIHPSYRDSRPHECLLTDFCRKNSVPLFDAHDWLHPDGVPKQEMFHDVWHPTARGHRSMADGLAAFLCAHLPP
jgi:hypothetical protein